MKKKNHFSTTNSKVDKTSISKVPLTLIETIIKRGNKRLRLVKRKGIEHKVSIEKGLEELCLYDGTKLRSYDQDYIKWLMETYQILFDLKPTLDAAGKKIISYKGKYENLEVKIFLNRRNNLWLLDISGSLHKFFNIFSKNERQNYNDFYWKDFLQVYKELIRVFKFNPHEIDVVNLEAGVNCIVPSFIGLPTSEIMENIISVLGECRNVSSIRKPYEDFFKVERGERYFKFYDKAIQNKLVQQVIRLELGYKRSRPIVKDCKAKSLFDLSKPETSLLLRDCLIKAAKTLHVFHPDLLNVPLHEIEDDRDVLKFSVPSFWCHLKHKNRYQHDRKREKHERLINKYCRCNLSKAIVEMLIKKL